MSGRRHEHELALDPTLCDAHGFCAEFLPDLIELDEWGYPVLAGGGLRVRVPVPLVGEARRAVSACPVGALRFTRIEP